MHPCYAIPTACVDACNSIARSPRHHTIMSSWCFRRRWRVKLELEQAEAPLAAGEPLEAVHTQGPRSGGRDGRGQLIVACGSPHVTCSL